MTNSSAPLVNVGISACLLGHSVRYNGGHSQSSLCLNSLSQHVNFVAFCPEVAAGFGTPRPSMRLYGDPQQPQLRPSNGGSSDLTPQLIAGFTHSLPDMATLCGYVVMKNSPSCGLERIKVYQDNGHPHPQKTRGIFTAALMQQYPNLPVEEEGRLHDPGLRENFMLRVYVLHDFQQNVAKVPSHHKLIQFHSRHKLLLLAHSQGHYRQLGTLLAQASDGDIAKLSQNYLWALMQALHKPAKRADNTNAMLHVLGYLKASVPATARRKVAQTIEDYHRERVPLIAPMTLLNHYIEQFGRSYIREQSYLNPYPAELGLRNRI